MSVKDVLQSLVDDGMVDTERIGTSNYFWAYPSKALHAVSVLFFQVNNFYDALSLLPELFHYVSLFYTSAFLYWNFNLSDTSIGLSQYHL